MDLTAQLLSRLQYGAPWLVSALLLIGTFVLLPVI
jgi:hypothetical protein